LYTLKAGHRKCEQWTKLEISENREIWIGHNRNNKKTLNGLKLLKNEKKKLIANTTFVE